MGLIATDEFGEYGAPPVGLILPRAELCCMMFGGQFWETLFE
jgi:hypothetical protein